jgi:MHS family proline/betaine transporter-like MFS transporter
LEWFDFAVYGYFAADIGALFFPRSDSSLQLIVSFGVFAIGYLMRPVGSLVLGPVGDLLGRRSILISSVVVMGGCSLLIALLPTYASWGPWAAYALLALRMLQGLSVGGEYTGSITLVFGTSQPERRGWRSAVRPLHSGSSHGCRGRCRWGSLPRSPSARSGCSEPDKRSRWAARRRTG